MPVLQLAALQQLPEVTVWSLGGLVGATGAVAGTALGNSNAGIGDFGRDLAISSVGPVLSPMTPGGKAIRSIDDLGDELWGLNDDIFGAVAQLINSCSSKRTDDDE